MACGKLFELFCHRFFEENIKSITLKLVSPFTVKVPERVRFGNESVHPLNLVQSQFKGSS